MTAVLHERSHDADRILEIERLHALMCGMDDPLSDTHMRTPTRVPSLIWGNRITKEMVCVS